MSENQYYIPDELSKAFNEITLQKSPHHQTFKQWWNKGADSLLQDNSQTQTKSLTSGLSDLTILKNDLKHRLEAKINTIKQKRESLFKRIDECTVEPCSKLLQQIWNQPSLMMHHNINQSLELLDDQLSDELEAPLSNLEHIRFSVKRILQILESAEKLYAKYLGLAQFLSYYWEYDLLSYFEDAKGIKPVVSWDGILNVGLKELKELGHVERHATYIRFMFYREEEELSVQKAYEAISKEVDQLGKNFTYKLPSEPLNLNKSAQKHIKKLH